MKKYIVMSILTTLFFLGFGGLVQADLTDGLVAYYPFNGNANDESGKNHDGNIKDGATLTSDRFGNTDSAYSFNGNGYIAIGDYEDLKLTEIISLQAWVKIQSLRNSVGIVGKGNSQVRNYSLRIDEDSKISWHVEGLDNPTLESDLPLEIGNWYQVVGVYDSKTSKSKLYINGILNVEVYGMCHIKTHLITH